MSWTHDELQALRKAYASGTLRVSFEGRSVEYGSAADLLSRIRLIESEMAGQSGTRAPRRSLASFRKGWTPAAGWELTGTGISAGRIVPIDEGTNAGVIFQLLTAGAIVPGTTALDWKTSVKSTTAQFVPKTINVASYTLLFGDRRRWILATRNGNQTFTIPNLDLVPWQNGTEIVFFHNGSSGTKTITGATGVFINGVDGGSVVLDVRYDAWLLKHRSKNQWFAVPWKQSPPAATKALVIAASDETSALTTGTKVTFRMPYAMTLAEVRAAALSAALSCASATGPKSNSSGRMSKAASSAMSRWATACAPTRSAKKKERFPSGRLSTGSRSNSPLFPLALMAPQGSALSLHPHPAACCGIPRTSSERNPR